MFNFPVLVLGLGCLAVLTNAGVIHQPAAVALTAPVAYSSQSIHQVHGPSYAPAYAAAPVAYAAPAAYAGYHHAPALAYTAGVAHAPVAYAAAPAHYAYAANVAPGLTYAAGPAAAYAVDPFVGKVHLK